MKFDVRVQGIDSLTHTYRRWSARTTEWMAQVTGELAGEYLEDVSQFMPRGRGWKAYRRALSIARLGSSSEFVIFADMPVETLRGGDQQHDKVVLYVEPKTGIGAVDRPSWIDILQDYSPWTWSTLPVVPPSQWSRVLSRKVRPDEYDEVELNRRWDRETVHNLLRETGLEEGKIKRELAADDEVEATVDLGFEVLRAELGLGTQGGRPHWRPAAEKFRTTTLPRLVAKRGKHWLRGLAGVRALPAWSGDVQPESVGRDVERFQAQVF